MAAPKIKEDLEETHSDHDELDEHDDHSSAHMDFGHGGAKHEEGEGPWLVSYADLMTLLMGFFALMLSFSTIDEKKFDAMREETTEFFGGEYVKPFEELKNAIEKVIKEKGLSEQVKIEVSSEGVGLTFQGTIFFDTGAVNLRPEAVSLLEELIPVIKTKAPDFFILVEGHTDDVPISTGLLASNWELSAVRASTVVRIFEDAQFDRKKLIPVGWSDTKPVAPNRDETLVAIAVNQAKNRRVVIRILKHSPF